MTEETIKFAEYYMAYYTRTGKVLKVKPGSNVTFDGPIEGVCYWPASDGAYSFSRSETGGRSQQYMFEGNTFFNEYLDSDYLIEFCSLLDSDENSIFAMLDDDAPSTDPQPVDPEPTAPPAENKTAKPSSDKLTVNGVEGTPTVYNIDDNNYFKIRDVAALLNGTEKQFSVGYDGETQSVTATTGQGYEKLSTDLAGAPDKAGEARASGDAIYVDGAKITPEVYNINGNNYFKLRDLGEALDFYIGWTLERGVYIETDKPYAG